MTIMYEKAGIYEIIYIDLQGKETRVESRFTISIAYKNNSSSEVSSGSRN